MENCTFLQRTHLLTLMRSNISHSSPPSFFFLPILHSLSSGPGAFRLHSTAYIQLCRGSEHGGDTSIDTSDIQSYHRDMMQCRASIISLISQWLGISLDPPQGPDMQLWF